MGMGLAHARHQGGAGAVDHRHAGRGNAARATADACDAVALHQHLTLVGLGPGGVDYAYVREEDIRHVDLLSRNRFNRPSHSSGFSTGVQWPQPRSTSTRLPAIRSAIMRTAWGGATTSSSPVTSRVGHSILDVSAGPMSASAARLRTVPSGSL